MGLFDEVGSLLGGGNNTSQTVAQGTVTPIVNPITGQAVTNAGATTADSVALQQALAAQAAGGVSQGLAGQTQLGQALANQAAGGGPNPAQAALNQNTGTNVANQAALAAGVRGASSNAGLIARQSGQQGAATQQAAVGQGATLQANQTLAAQQQLAALAAQQVGQGTAAANAATTGSLGQQSNLIGGINAQNTVNTGLQQNQNTGNLGLATTNANNSANAVGGLFNSLGAGAGSAASGGSAGSAISAAAAAAKGGVVGKSSVTPPSGSNTRVKMPAHLESVHGIYHAMAGGGEIPGRAPVKGNSPTNDRVPIMASPGEIMIPRSVTQSQDPVGESAKFVAALLEKQGKSGHGDFQTALKEAIKSRKKK